MRSIHLTLVPGDVQRLACKVVNNREVSKRLGNFKGESWGGGCSSGDGGHRLAPPPLLQSLGKRWNEQGCGDHR